MKILTLSSNVLKTCEKNYSKNCGDCPLRTLCVAPVGTGQKALNVWIEKLNRKAKDEDQNTEVEVCCPECGTWHMIPISNYMPENEYVCINCFYNPRFQESYIE